MGEQESTGALPCGLGHQPRFGKTGVREGCPERGPFRRQGEHASRGKRGFQRRGDWNLSTEGSGRKRLPSRSSGTWTTQGDRTGKEQSPTRMSWQTPFSARSEIVSTFLSSPPTRSGGSLETNWNPVVPTPGHENQLGVFTAQSGTQTPGLHGPSGGTLWAARRRPPAPGPAPSAPNPVIAGTTEVLQEAPLGYPGT